MEMDLILDKIKDIPYTSRTNLEIMLPEKRTTLDGRISSLIKRNIITRIKKGFYLINPYYEKEADKQSLMEYLGCIVYSPSYVSLGYALSFYGIIPESIYKITYVTSKKTRSIDFGFKGFIYKNIKGELFTGFETKNYKDKKIYFASKAKALFDFLYFMSLKSNADAIGRYIISEARMNFGVMKSGDIKEFKRYVKLSGSKKMSMIESEIVKAVNES